ncbi:hypothetical protein GGR56DRAFT_214486 [Xylariaceae sp. FL0804]|nr:hypothetical protein GGR56DRAFT_214486 [Xylariaceae sp. FL0804]
MSHKNDVKLLVPGTPSPQRPRHQVKRSITEVSPPPKSHRHHRLHARRKERDRDQRLPWSAGSSIHLPRGSLDMPRSEGVTPSTDIRRRSDLLQYGAEQAENATRTATTRASAPSREERLGEQRKKTAATRAGLQKSLVDLSSYSDTTMRRLDDTYYSVLERLSALQSTIVAIKELAGMSQEVPAAFETESQGLVEEMEAQLAQHDPAADDQQRRIAALQARIQTGRGRTRALGGRLDAVRDRVEGWERADRAWQEKTRRRLRVLWIITLAAASALLLLYFLSGGGGAAPAAMMTTTTTTTGDRGAEGHGAGHLVAGNHSRSAAAMADQVREALSRQRGDGLEEERVLGAFDEL